jgi:hypothetical protein
LTGRVQGLGHKLFMDNFFSSPRLFDDLEWHKINTCGTIQPHKKDMSPDFGLKKTKIEKGWCKGEDQGKFDCISLEGRVRSLHPNMDPPPAEGNFCENKHPVKPQTIARHNQHMG